MSTSKKPISVWLQRKLVQSCFYQWKIVFYTPQNKYKKQLCVILGFTDVLTSFWSNLYKVDTCLERTHRVGPVGVRYTQVSLYTNDLGYFMGLFLKISATKFSRHFFHVRKNLRYLLHWKLFKNNKKCFLFHPKSSFCSQDI